MEETRECCEDNIKGAEAKTAETKSKWEKVGATKHDPLEKREGHSSQVLLLLNTPREKIKGKLCGGTGKQQHTKQPTCTCTCFLFFLLISMFVCALRSSK